MTRTILIVHEDVQLVGDVADALRRHGWSVVTAETFRDAVRLLNELSPEILVTALQLGAYNGLHLLVRRRADFPGLIGVVIGPSDPVVEREASALGATAYLVKPVTAAAIAGRVRELVPDDDDDDTRAHSTALVTSSSWI